MMFNKKFNRIISIGEDCACAGWLKKKNLRTASYPFDWLTGASFRTRVELILSDFTGFLTRNNMRRLEKPTSGRFDMKNDSYENERFISQYVCRVSAPITIPETGGGK